MLSCLQPLVLILTHRPETANECFKLFVVVANPLPDTPHFDDIKKTAGMLCMEFVLHRLPPPARAVGDCKC